MAIENAAPGPVTPAPASAVDPTVRDEARSYLVAWYALVISILGHAGQTLMFAWMGFPGMSTLNVASVLILAFALWRLVSARAVETAFLIALAELLANNLTATAILGIEAGFLVYPLFGIGIVATIPFCPVRQRLAGAIAGYAVVFAILYVISQTGPIDPADIGTTTGLLIANLINMALGTAVVLWFYSREIARAERELVREYERSEDLLLTILPASIATRLKSGEKTIADDYSDATVLFADIVGFTEQAAQMPADELVSFLDDLFSRFDALADAAGVEKIKTIGDAYMAVCGVPVARPDHADAVARLALQMIAAAEDFTMPNGRALRLRIGIHSGPLVGGVISARRMTFDLWGDVVNTASRMESTGEPGRVQISRATHDLLKGRFGANERGTVEVKGKGAMKTWLLGPEMAQDPAR